MADYAKYVGIFGLPVDNMTLDETVSKIFDLCNDYLLDKRPRLVATVNVDFLVNLHSAKNYQVRHPELMAILRQADVVTPDGMPLLWFSRLMGKPLRERVTGADLVPQIAQEATRLKKSIFFLGGSGDVAKRAAQTLQKRSPELMVAGFSSHYVHVEGEYLADDDIRDDEIVEKNNYDKPDILLIAFGNPKQEIWYWRNRHRLKVPVSIGIGGTFNFVTGAISRAPEWMQKIGLEWVYRITQDPARLWRRYFYGFVKLTLFVAPLLPRVLYSAKPKTVLAGASNRVRLIFGQDKISILLPSQVTGEVVKTIVRDIEAVDTEHLEFDFADVEYVDIAAIGELLVLRRDKLRENCTMTARNINPTLRRTLIAHRSLDLFDMNYLLSGSTAQSEDGESTTVQGNAPYSLNSDGNISVLSFFDRLDAHRVSQIDTRDLQDKLKGSDVIIDLTKVRFVDSSAIGFLVKIKRIARKTGNKVVICGIKDMVRQVFRMTRMELVFELAENLREADVLLRVTT